MAGHHSSEKEKTSGHNASGFTAVNGKELPPNGTNGRVEVVVKGGSDSTDRREEHVGSQSASRQHSRRPSQDVPRREMPNGNHQYSSSHENSPASSPGKRKRSLTDDGRGSSGSSRYDLSPPRRASGSPAGLVDPRIQRAQDADRNHTSYINGSNGVESHNMRGHDNHWQANRPPPPPGYQTNGHHMDASDAQLAEALQGETQAQNSHRTWGIGGPPDDDSADQYGAYGTDRASQGAVQAGPKRKRVFSNRTKTGCMTCRKRKKKCDEAHPFCEFLQLITLVDLFLTFQATIACVAVSLAKVTIPVRHGKSNQTQRVLCLCNQRMATKALITHIQAKATLPGRNENQLHTKAATR